MRKPKRIESSRKEQRRRSVLYLEILIRMQQHLEVQLIHFPVVGRGHVVVEELVMRRGSEDDGGKWRKKRAVEMNG